MDPTKGNPTSQPDTSEIIPDGLAWAADGYSQSDSKTWFEKQTRAQHHVNNAENPSTSQLPSRPIQRIRSSIKRNPSTLVVPDDDPDALRAAAALDSNGEQQQHTRSVTLLAPHPPDDTGPTAAAKLPAESGGSNLGSRANSLQRRQSLRTFSVLFSGDSKSEKASQQGDGTPATGGAVSFVRKLTRALSSSLLNRDKDEQGMQDKDGLSRQASRQEHDMAMVTAAPSRRSIQWTDGQDARSEAPASPSKVPRAGRQRRQSFLQKLGINHGQDDDGEGDHGHQQGQEHLPDTPGAVSLGGASVRSARSRRASFIDFFRKEEGSLQAQPDKSQKGGRSRRPSQSDAVSVASVNSKARRGSVIDIFNKKALALLTGKEYQEEGAGEQEVVEAAPLWFTSLDDFKPITFMYYRGRYMCSFFACSIRTGEHFILKKYEREKMLMSDERSVRRALAFASSLKHDNLTKIMGTWEADDALYIVEEYASKGDMQQDSMAHPERYTEKYMALNVVKPLLDVLSYLHRQKIIHRALYPENVMFGRDGKLRIGHYTSLVDISVEPPTDRCDFLDYMAPEMLAMKDDEERMRSQASPREGGAGPGAGRGRRKRSTAFHADAPEVLQQLGGGDGGAAQGSPSPGGGDGVQAVVVPATVHEDEVLHHSSNQAPVMSRISDNNGHKAPAHLPSAEIAGVSPRSKANTASPMASPRVSRRSHPNGVLSMLSRKMGGATVAPADRTIIVPHNSWEWQDSYDEKADIWQVGCLVHEVLCGVLPFEAEDKLLAAALILWADIQVFPDNLSPQCVSFIQACLTKDPRTRPGAESLLKHEWITRQEAGEQLLTQGEIAASGARTNADGTEGGVVRGAWNIASSLLPSWLGGRSSAVAPAAAASPTQPAAISAKAYQKRAVSAAAGQLTDSPLANAVPAVANGTKLEVPADGLDGHVVAGQDSSATSGAPRFPSRKKAMEEPQQERPKPDWRMLF